MELKTGAILCIPGCFLAYTWSLFLRYFLSILSSDFIGTACCTNKKYWCGKCHPCTCLCPCTCSIIRFLIKLALPKKYKIKFLDKQHKLTHYQTTNFRLFQTERVCRQQFQIWQKWQKVILTGRKHCGKRRNCLLRAISPFPTVFSKGLFPRGVKRCHCVGMGKVSSLFKYLLIAL